MLKLKNTVLQSEIMIPISGYMVLLYTEKKRENEESSSEAGGMV